MVTTDLSAGTVGSNWDSYLRTARPLSDRSYDAIGSTPISLTMFRETFFQYLKQ